MKNYVLVFVVLFLSFLAWYYSKYPLTSSVTIHNHKIFVELAITADEKRKGLSDRDSLSKNHGMLFLMGEPAYHGFWMKDMRFPLDFVWIKDKTIVDLTNNVHNPIGNDIPVSIKPKVPADKVLEVNAGTISSYQITIGDNISFKN